MRSGHLLVLVPVVSSRSTTADSARDPGVFTVTATGDREASATGPILDERVTISGGTGDIRASAATAGVAREAVD
jgi:hypothetical protein